MTNTIIRNRLAGRPSVVAVSSPNVIALKLRAFKANRPRRNQRRQRIGQLRPLREAQSAASEHHRMGRARSPERSPDCPKCTTRTLPPRQDQPACVGAIHQIGHAHHHGSGRRAQGEDRHRREAEQQPRMHQNDDRAERPGNPKRCGSASWLRVTDCSAAPTKARLAPTNAPSTTRSHTSQMILSRPADHVTSTDWHDMIEDRPQTTSSGTAPRRRDRKDHHADQNHDQRDTAAADVAEDMAKSGDKVLMGHEVPIRVPPRAARAAIGLFRGKAAASRLTASILRGPGVASTYSSTTNRSSRTAGISLKRDCPSRRRSFLQR